MQEYDTYERFKPFEGKEGTIEGDTHPIPIEDNDTKYYFYDFQGESIYTNPPDPNIPVIDHGLDEEHIWAFGASGYNQFVIKNEYGQNLWEATKNFHLPFWAPKLQTPAFYKEEKYEKMMKQWQTRLKLEMIKMRQALVPNKDLKTKQ